MSEAKRRTPRRLDNSEAIWLGENQDFLEENYPGKWVAVKGKELIAVGDTASEVLAEAKKRGVHNPVVSGVRRAEFRGAVFIRHGLKS